tara:strand:- start:114 stop:230 length:117 start_codon:yes stop_codon:yes gene_type:complete
MSELERYQEAYQVLMDYWDELSDESKKELDVKLKKVDL